MWQTVGLVVCGVLVLISIAVFLYALKVRLEVNDGMSDPMVTDERRLDGQFIIITGGNRGIGYETAFALAKRGAQVTLACRNEIRGKRAERMLNDRLLSEFGESKGKCTFQALDLSKLVSVRRFVKEYEASGKPLHILINNAGMGSPRCKFTADGFELTMQCNYIAHFMLTHLLLPLLVRSAKQDETISRIINVSSVWHKHGDINVHLWRSEQASQKKAYGTTHQYSSSKLAQILHASYLQTEVLNQYKLPVCVFSAHPGGVDTDIFGIDKHGWLVRTAFAAVQPCWKFAMRTPEAGAQTSVHCAVSELKKGSLEPGNYHSSCSVGRPCHPKQHHCDSKLRQELWDWSMEVLNLTPHDWSSA